MTLQEFKELRSLEGRQVRMTFSDGQSVIATLLSVSCDFDDSRHIVYDKVEWSALPHRGRTSEAFHTFGEELLVCTACNTDEQL
jgi:hypothetical protein